MKCLSLRTRYQGEISGLILLTSDESQRQNLVVKLASQIRNAAMENNQVKFQQGLWRATGLLIATPS